MQQYYRLRIKFLSIVLLLGISLKSQLLAQSILPLAKAVELAIEKNISLQLQETQAEIARANVTKGNAGLLPIVNFNLNQTNSLTNPNQLLANGTTIERNNAAAYNTNANISAAWTVFEGGANTKTYERLKILHAQADVLTRFTLETLVADVWSSYYNCVFQERLLVARKAAVELSRQRLQIAQARAEVGTGSKLDALQAQVDVNADEAAILAQNAALKDAYAALALLLQEPSLNAQAEDSIPLQLGLEVDYLQQQANAQNKQLLLTKINTQLAESNLQIAKAAQYPQVQLLAGYNFTNVRAEGNFVLQNRNYGLNYGINVSMNLFDGGNRKREIQNALLQTQLTELQTTQLSQTIQVNINRLFERYRLSLSRLELEQQNLAVAQKNAEIAAERYKIGAVAAIEVRQAQTALVEARTRLATVRYEAKLTEIELRALSGGFQFTP